MVYLGTEREATFSVNSRAQLGFKYRVTPDLPFKIHDDDLWIASIRGMQVLSTLDFVPTTIRHWDIGDATYCSPWEGAFLEGLAANCPDPARVVEIGTGKGSSLARIMYGLALHQDVRVWTIDLLEQEEAKEEMERAQIPNWRYEFLVGDSVEYGQIEGWEELDLVLIDGSHSYEGVKADGVWLSHLKPEGVVVFHDYRNRKHKVTKAVDELMVKPWKRVGLVGTMAAYTRLIDG
jgi:predicted O-methyltransferase YrrM